MYQAVAVFKELSSRIDPHMAYTTTVCICTMYIPTKEPRINNYLIIVHLILLVIEIESKEQ